jgi:hypothetical protein
VRKSEPAGPGLQRFDIFPGVNLPHVIGPFSYFDARVSATQRVFDWKSIQKYRSSVIGEEWR